MKSQRRFRAVRIALVSCLAFTFVSLIAHKVVTAQEQKSTQKSEAPKTKPTPPPTVTPNPQGREAGEIEVVNSDLLT